jgi:hypothetical protein
METGEDHWDGTDPWPVVQGTTLSLPASYLVNETWVSGTFASLSLPIDIDGSVITLDLHHVVLTMKLDLSYETADRADLGHHAGRHPGSDEDV